MLPLWVCMPNKGYKLEARKLEREHKKTDDAICDYVRKKKLFVWGRLLRRL